jgi:hypothetical protein
MSEPLYTASLNRLSPRYKTWLDILGSEEVPLSSASSFPADLATERRVEVYRLNMSKLTTEQRCRLVEWIQRNFGDSPTEIEHELNTNGVPIRAADVTVAFSVRAFI